jgi:aminocarboxymuconate-semialdehyde decarboxylase
VVIDAHSHFLPLALLDFLRQGRRPGIRVDERDGTSWIVYDTGLQIAVTRVYWDVEAKLEQMDREGVDVALPSIAAPVFLYELEPAAAAETCAVVNDAAVALAADSGGRLRPMATVPMNDPSAAAAELRRAHNLGLVGVEIGTSVGETTLDEPEFDPFLAAAAELAMPVMLHPYRSMSGDGLPTALRRFFLANVIGNPFETCVAASRLILGGAFDRHPKLRVQLSHGGGSFPYQLGRLQHAYESREVMREVVQRARLEYLGNLLFDTVIYEPRALRFLIELVGVERVVFGSDHPFDMADFSALKLAEEIDQETAEKVLELNARREYGLQ